MPEPDQQIWDGMLAHLRRHHPTICRQWFEEIEPIAVAAGALNLRAHSNVHRDYLRRQCSEPFNDAARTVTGRLIAVRFLGPDDDGPASNGSYARGRNDEPSAPRRAGDVAHTADRGVALIEPKPSRSAEPPPVEHPPVRTADDTLVINPDYSFEHFIVGSGNRLAHAATVAVAGNPGRAYNPLFIHGGVGLGKTHLLQAICIKIKEQNPDAVICYLSCEGFVTQFIEAVSSGQMSNFRHRFRDVDMLIIDDIHFLSKGDRTQEEFFHTFNSLYQAQKQIVLSSDAAPEEIPNLEERLVSRFKWGLVAKMDPPDYETRVAILKNKARMRNLAMPDDVANFIAARIDKNIRELEGAIGKLQIVASVEGAVIDLGLAQQALGELAPRPTAEPTVQSIMAAVTDFYRVRLFDLQSERRHRSIAQPRQVCMYLIRQHTRHSLEEIGGYFGNRDHTTVMHAIRTVDDRRGHDPNFDATIKALEAKIQQT